MHWSGLSYKLLPSSLSLMWQVTTEFVWVFFFGYVFLSCQLLCVPDRDLRGFSLFGCVVLACLSLLPSCCRCSFFFFPSHWAAEIVPQWKFKHPQVSSQLSLCFLRVNRQFLFLQEILLLMEWVWSPVTLKKLHFSVFWNETFASFKNVFK